MRTPVWFMVIKKFLDSALQVFSRWPLNHEIEYFSFFVFTAGAPDIRKNVIDSPEIRTVNFFNSDYFSARAVVFSLCVAGVAIDTRGTNEDNISSSACVPKTTGRGICERRFRRHPL